MQSTHTSFDKAYGMYFHAMVLYAMKFVQVEEVAEDITQEVFSRLWQKENKLVGDDAWIRLLHVSVKNRCLDYIKHEAVKKNYTSIAVHETEEEFEDAIFATEIYSLFLNEVEKLPLRQRQTIKMVCEGKTNAEIAEQLNLSIDTVKNHKRRAIATLRTKLNDPLLLAFLAALLEKQ